MNELREAAKMTKAIEDEINNPEFNESDTGLPERDWRRYVPEELREIWPKLGAEARLSIYIMARAIDRETWE